MIDNKMKVITSTHYNRPSHTSELLDSLHNCIGIEDYFVIFCVEPGCDEVINLIQRDTSLNKKIVINDKLLGLWVNKKHALEQGFACSDYVIHLEDDLLLSRDALKFFEWCNATFKTQQAIFSATAFSNQTPESSFRRNLCPHCSSQCGYYQVRRRRDGPSPLAWATWKDRWLEYKDEWSGEDVRLHVCRKDRFEVFPVLSRATHTGIDNGIFHQPLGLSGGVNTTLSTRPVSLSTVKRLNHDLDLISGRSSPTGGEWIKLDDNNIKSRGKSESYQHVLLEFWAGSIEDELPEDKFEKETWYV